MSADRKYKAIGFDMDGTLLDTAIDYEKLGNAEEYVLSGLGVPSSELTSACDDIDMIRKGVAYLNRNGNGISFDDACKLVNARDTEMEKVDEARPFPKAVELLKKIHSLGLKTGLLTRGCREYAEAAVKICGVADLLDGIVARDDYPESEAKPSPLAMEHMAERIGVKTTEILYFGDHTFDYQCARDAGSGFVAVLTGTFTKEDWEQVPDIQIFDSVGDYCDSLD